MNCCLSIDTVDVEIIDVKSQIDGLNNKVVEKDCYLYKSCCIIAVNPNGVIFVQKSDTDGWEKILFL